MYVQSTELEMEKGPRGRTKKRYGYNICASRYVCVCVCVCRFVLLLSFIYTVSLCMQTDRIINIVTRRTSPRIKSMHITPHISRSLFGVLLYDAVYCTYYLYVAWTDKGNHFKMKKKKVHLFLISLYPHAKWYLISTDFEASGENIICYYCAPCCIVK